MIPFLLGFVLLANGSIAKNVDYEFHWAASPLTDGNGNDRPAAVAYEVFVQRGSSTEALVATVNDTIYTLSAEPGVVQRLMVRAVDAEGRFSVMSAVSDPIYFEDQDDRGAPPVLPLAAVLGANYPNPFNPETRVRYGVPDNLTGNESMRLSVYNIKGQLVRNLEVDPTPGWHEVVWDGTDETGKVASTGMYLTRFMVGSMVTTGKMTMVK